MKLEKKKSVCERVELSERDAIQIKGDWNEKKEILMELNKYFHCFYQNKRNEEFLLGLHYDPTLHCFRSSFTSLLSFSTPFSPFPFSVYLKRLFKSEFILTHR